MCVIWNTSAKCVRLKRGSFLYYKICSGLLLINNKKKGLLTSGNKNKQWPRKTRKPQAVLLTIFMSFSSVLFLKDISDYFDDCQLQSHNYLFIVCVCVCVRTVFVWLSATRMSPWRWSGACCRIARADWGCGGPEMRPHGGTLSY